MATGRLRRGGRAVHALLAFGMFLCRTAAATAADGKQDYDNAGDCQRGLVCFTSWWKHGPEVTIPWVVVFTCSPLALVSLVMAMLGSLELAGCIFPPACCRSYFGINLTLLLLWPFFLAPAVYTVVVHVWVNMVFVGAGAAAVLVHSVICSVYWRRYAASRAQNSDHPRQQLLTSMPQSTDPRVEQPAEVQNPFQGRTMYGLIPGTSNYGFVIFIPTEPEMEYSGLPSRSPNNPNPIKTHEIAK